MADIVPLRTGGDAGSGNAREALKSGGGDGTFDGMEIRVKALEDDMKEIKKDLKALLIDSAEIKGSLKGMPTAATIGELKGRVDSLPTTAKVGSFFGIAVAVIVILNNFPAIKAAFLP